MTDENTPVLIGAGQFTYRGEPGQSPSPTALLKIAAERAAADAGLGVEALADIDGLAVVGFTIDAPGGGGKVPINPEYLLHRDDGVTILRNYENKVFTYPEPSSDPLRFEIAGYRRD